MTFAAEYVDTDLWADHELANRVLDNIEQMHPQYWRCCYTTGSWRQVVRKRIEWYKGTMARLEKAMPNEPYENLEERARDCLGGLNQNWQREKRLTKEETKMLAEFREKHRL